MKHYTSYLIPTIYLLLSSIVACKKNVDDTPVTPTVATINTPPLVNLEDSISVTLPPDYVYLNAWVTDSQSNVDKIEWKQIDGPSQVVFSTPNLLSTKAYSLVKGKYSIEFVAIDKGGLSDKDTVNIWVSTLPPSTSEIVFQNQQWDCFWGCFLPTFNISTIPPNAPVLVYIKRDDANTWIQIPGPYQQQQTDMYYYWIDDGKLFISVDERTGPSDTPDVKIVY